MWHSLNAATIAKTATELRTVQPMGIAAPNSEQSAWLTGQECMKGHVERFMATKQQTKQQTEPGRLKHEQRSAEIGVEIIRLLGRPEGLRRVDVRELWDCHFRVNVVVGPNNAAPRLAHSFFVVTDEKGKVLSAEPKVDRLYA
jgi:hypothetical protein